jgi:hypothetical protein
MDRQAIESETIQNSFIQERQHEDNTMSHTGAWKVFEKRAAVLFSGVRNAFSGAAPALTGTRADIKHRYLFVECKQRQKHSLFTLWDSVKAKADSERKISVIALAEHHRRGCLIVLHSDDLERLSSAGRLDDLPLFQ